MDQQQIIASIEERARRLRVKNPDLSMGEICRRAEIHPTTFSRWKLSDRNPEPVGATLTSLKKIEDVIAAAEQLQGITPPAADPGPLAEVAA